MSVINTTNASLGKPTVGNSLNVWGTELNSIFDLLDKIIMSQNFAEGTHTGLNFNYGNGRIKTNTTLTSVVAGTIALTDNTTNYIEVSTAGTVSKNTTAFTEGSISLYQVITASGAITTITDKRAYLYPSWEHLFSLTSAIETAKNMKITGTLSSWDNTYNYLQLQNNSALVFSSTDIFIINNAYYNSGWKYVSNGLASYISLATGKFIVKTAVSGTAGNAITWIDMLTQDANRNILINGAAAETGNVGGLTLKQGTNPASNTADQVTLFATSGSNSSLGIAVEPTISDNILPFIVNTEQKYLNLRKTNLNPLAGFLTSSLTIVNTTTETDILNITIPAMASGAGGRLFEIKLLTNLTTAAAAHTMTITCYVNTDTYAVVNGTAGTFTNSKGWINFYLYVKDSTNYSMGTRASYAGSTFTGASDATETFTSNVTLRVTGTWNTANVGSSLTVYAATVEVKN